MGFFEGNPDFVVDIFARTAVIHNYANPPASGIILLDVIKNVLVDQIPWINTILHKVRNSTLDNERRGKIIYGKDLDQKILEHGVWYNINLTLNRDCSFYLDTRNLRKWVIENSQSKTVLNTFAYTSSLGISALAGGAKRVVQIDRNQAFMNLAKRSYALNGFQIDPRDFIVGDFFSLVKRFKQQNIRFDCVFLDPPFFAVSQRSGFNLVHDSRRLVNKVRPLINDRGRLVIVNNALYLSGQEFFRTLTLLCEDGYLKIETLIPIPGDIVGYPCTISRFPVINPAPFNHSTKIAVLSVRRKED